MSRHTLCEDAIVSKVNALWKKNADVATLMVFDSVSMINWREGKDRV